MHRPPFRHLYVDLTRKFRVLELQDRLVAFDNLLVLTSLSETPNSFHEVLSLSKRDFETARAVMAEEVDEVRLSKHASHFCTDSCDNRVALCGKKPMVVGCSFGAG